MVIIMSDLKVSLMVIAHRKKPKTFIPKLAHYTLTACSHNGQIYMYHIMCAILAHDVYKLSAQVLNG